MRTEIITDPVVLAHIIDLLKSFPDMKFERQHTILKGFEDRLGKLI